MSNGEPIIIRGGGSIEVILFKDTWPADVENAHRHVREDRKITRVTITDDSANTTDEITLPSSGKFTIRIHHDSTENAELSSN
jgi:hypothetical protein